MTDDHLEHIVSHNWGMDAAIVPGGHDKALNLPGEVIDLVGDRLDLQAIAQAVPGADADAAASVATTAKNPCGRSCAHSGCPAPSPASSWVPRILRTSKASPCTSRAASPTRLAAASTS